LFRFCLHNPDYAGAIRKTAFPHLIVFESLCVRLLSVIRAFPLSTDTGGTTMWNIPTQEELNIIPRLYGTQQIPLKDKIIDVHLFIGSCDYFIAETDGTDIYFGFAILNGGLDLP
jgi:hypothetical protein